MMCARAIFLLNSLLATTCVTGISLKPLSLSEASTAALDKSPEEAAALVDSGSARGPHVGLTGNLGAAPAETEDQKKDETEKNEGDAADDKADDKKADDKKADDNNADNTEAADDTASQDAEKTDAAPAETQVDDNNTDDSNETLTELLDQIAPNTIYLGVGQKIQDAYQEVSKAVQKFEQLDHIIMGDFKKQLEDIKGRYVQIYNKVQKKVKAIQTDVKQAKDKIQQDPASTTPLLER